MESKTRKFYLSVPGTVSNPQGEVDEIDPHLMTVAGVFPAVCNPGEGLALIPRQRLVTSCGDIIRISDGKVLKTVPGLGSTRFGSILGRPTERQITVD